MKYDKPPLSFEEQADRMIQRGLIADRSLLVERLKQVNYYRLSGYLFPYRQPDDRFKPGTTFEKAWRHYAFDRRLRILVMDAVERVEVGIRTQLIYNLSHQFGPFGYCDFGSFPKLEKKQYDKWIKELREEAERNREIFVEHFRDRYGDKHKDLPLWMIGEIMSFGKILTIFNGCADSVRRSIAREYGVEDLILKSWLGALNVIRNVCAHHGRLWNRELGYKPYIPREQKYPQWHIPVKIPQNRIFGILTILRYLLKIIAPQSRWESRLLALLEEYPEISRWSMGFPDNWKDSLLWK
jgi:abortive infection bacteriophage resistance protein